MTWDNFSRHVGVVTVALIAVLTVLGVLWQVVHAHGVDPLLAGLCTLTIGLLIPTPGAATRVVVENDASDPVPVEPADDQSAPASRRGRRAS